VAQTGKPAAAPPVTSIAITPATPQPAEPPKKSRGFFGRLKDIFH